MTLHIICTYISSLKYSNSVDLKMMNLKLAALSPLVKVSKFIDNSEGLIFFICDLHVYDYDFS